MSKFKVGDVVERTGRDSNLWLDFTAADAGPYVVTNTTVGWIQINGYKGSNGCNTHPFEADKFKLVEQDDPLPPAPESVRYNDEYPDRFAYKQTWLDVKQDHNQVYIETGQYGEYNGVGMVLSPDAALQLAHDLNRMANEIKRKEKQRG